MIHNHDRTKIVSKLQHMLAHTLDEMVYGSSSLPGVTNAKEAIDWIVAVLYPNTKAAVATPADLPTGVDTPNIGDVAPTINDYRIVNDDGDGKAAGYLFAKYDTDVTAVWHKVYDFDWGINQVLQGLVDATQPLYAKKYGSTDYNPLTSLAITGTFAGQSIFGGDQTLQNLTLNANNFDGTGYVQFNDNARPTINSTFTLGTNTERFLNIFTDSMVSGTTTITGGTITDSSGTVDFSSDTVATLGLVSSDTLSVGTSGSIGSISISTTITTAGGTTDFSADNILTTGNISGGIGTFTSGQIGDFSIGTGTLTSLSATIDLGSNNTTTTGNSTVNTLTATTASIGSMTMSLNQILSAGTITLDGSSLYVNSGATINGTSLLQDHVTIAAGKTITFSGGIVVKNNGIDAGGLSIVLNGNPVPTIDATYSLGASANRWVDLHLSGALKTTTDLFSLSELMRFNSSQFRDAAKTIPLSNGDTIAFDSVSGKWLATSSTAADHLTISNLNGGPNGDGGHSVFPKLLGRSGGQIISGGILTAELLTLQNNVVDGAGLILSATEVKPTIDANTSIGSAVLRYTDIYMNGVADGLKIKDNATSGALDTYIGVGNAALDGKIGKFNDSLYFNNAGVKVKVGKPGISFTVDLTTLTSVSTDVSATFSNPQSAIWQVADSTGKIVSIDIQATATNVIITRDVAVPGAVLTVLGVEV